MRYLNLWVNLVTRKILFILPLLFFYIDDFYISLFIYITETKNINLNTNTRELNIYNPRCTNPSHILIYDGIWWVSNFRSIHKDVEKKQIRKITNSKKIPLTIVSNPDRAKKIRQVLHQAGVRVGDKPIANTIQVFRLEDYISVLKQCGRKEDEYRG